MVDELEMCRRAGIDLHMLHSWVEADWIHPQPGSEARNFSEMDVARAQLISDLAGAMGVNSEGVAIILSLLDQVHGLRRTLRRVNSALIAHDPSVRERILFEALWTL